MSLVGGRAWSLCRIYDQRRRREKISVEYLGEDFGIFGVQLQGLGVGQMFSGD